MTDDIDRLLLLQGNIAARMARGRINNLWNFLSFLRQGKMELSKGCRSDKSISKSVRCCARNHLLDVPYHVQGWRSSTSNLRVDLPQGIGLLTVGVNGNDFWMSTPFRVISFISSFASKVRFGDHAHISICPIPHSIGCGSTCSVQSLVALKLLAARKAILRWGQFKRHKCLIRPRSVAPSIHACEQPGFRRVCASAATEQSRSFSRVDLSLPVLKSGNR
jgi:hypothetical protein